MSEQRAPYRPCAVAVNGEAFAALVNRCVEDLARFNLPVSYETLSTRRNISIYVLRQCVAIEDVP